MKSLKSIIIAGIVLVVFIVASIIVINIPAPSEQTLEEEVSAPVKETVYILNEDYSLLTGFTVIPTERDVNEDTEFQYASEDFEVKITKTVDENGSIDYEYEAAPDPGKYQYNESLFRSMMYTLTSVTAKNLVEEDAKDISIYGLDEPTCTVKTFYEDGREIDIIIGSPAPVDGDYYCMTSVDNTVYTIGSYVGSLLCRRPIEYRDITLFPPYEAEDAYTNIDWIRITNRDGSVIEVLLDANQDNKYNTEKSQYVMLQPYQVSGNTSTIQSYIVDAVSTITLGSIIDDVPDEELGQYGLTNPARLEMTDISGNEVNILIGKTCPNPDYTFCMLDGTNTVITVSSSAFTCLDLNYVQFMLRTIWTYNIEQLESLNIDVDGEKYDIDVTHYVKKNANGNDADGVQGTLNGQEISELNIRRLFVRSLYFRIIDNLTEDEKKEFKDAEAYATITINLFDDESHTLELISISDRKYALRVDGEMEYYCYKKSLDDLVTSLGYVQEGDELDFAIG